MKRHFISAIAMLAAIAMFTTGCEKETNENPPICPVDTTTTSVFHSIQKMSLPLFKEVCAVAEPNENIMVSPLSLSELLLMLANGAEGETRQQIMDALQMGGLSAESASQTFYSINYYLCNADPKTKVSICNSIWIDNGLDVKSDYIKNNSLWFGADSYHQELEGEKALNDINNWCKEKTNGCIPSIFNHPLSGEDRMVLLNALYFKGIWKNKFKKSNTKDDVFHNIDGTKSTVKMMHQTENFIACSGEKFDVASFPYGNSTYVMDVILPHEGENLTDCLSTLDEEELNHIRHRMYTHEVNLYMPRWEMKYGADLKDILKAMGISRAFTDEEAEFPLISDHRMSLRKVSQASYIKVDEEGTEAASVSVGSMGDGAVGPSEPFTFNMNRPFAFIIHDKDSNAPLFIGRVVRL